MDKELIDEELERRPKEAATEAAERNRAEMVQGESGESFLAKKSVAFIAGILILFGLYLSSLYNYLLFHTLAEIFSIVVACGIFMIAWNSRRILDNNYLLLLGIAFLFIGVLDLVHTLAYKGMNIFQGYETNLPTQLWIAARYMESLSLLIAPVFLSRRLRSDFVIMVYALTTVLVLGSVFYWHIFPTCFVEGVGLTPFKKISEYVISIILIGAITVLFQKRKEFDENVFRLLVASIVVTIASELAFTFYINAYGFSNLVGHYLKIIAFYLIYKAIIETGLVKPYALLFRNLKQGEEALRKEKDFSENLIDTAQVIILVLDTEGRIIRFNPYMEDLCGYKLDEVQGRDWFSTFLPEEDHDRISELFRTCVSDVKTQGNINPIVSKDGRKIVVEWYDNTLKDADGKTIGILVIGQDITTRKQMEEKLLKAKNLESLGVLSGGIAHNFNNALSAITGHTELLEMDFPQDKKIADHTKTMKQSAHRMAHLTNQLLAYAGGGKYNAQPMSLSEFIEGTLPLIQHTLKPDIRLETDLPPDVLNAKVDRTQMQMVLSAIVANSNEATEPPGLIRISTRNIEVDQGFIKDHPGLKPGPYVSLSIEDNGKGMDKETKERIFEPFFTTHFIGRGLGMPSTYGIVTNHDGAITVDSEPGKGTTVSIYLPAISAESKGQSAERAEDRTVDLPTGEGTILVIEDEEPLIELFSKILEMLGYRVLQARTGEEAVELAKTFDGRIDLALLDIKLPDMDGGRVYPLIMEARPDLKVIVCSGYSIDGPAQEILDAGAEGFIQKPFLIAPFAEKLKEVLGGK